MSRLILPSILMLLLAACASGPEAVSTDALPADSMSPVSADAVGPSAGFSLPFPADSLLPDRRASGGGSILQDADEDVENSGGLTLVSEGAEPDLDYFLLLNSLAGEVAWARYVFAAGELAEPHSVLLRHSASQQGTVHAGIANWESMRWDWQSIPTDELASDPFIFLNGDTGRYVSPLGNIHCVILTHDGMGITLDNLELYLQQPALPPLDLRASQGSFYTSIFLDWTEVPGAEKYEIEYQEQGGGPADWQPLITVDQQPFDTQFWTHTATAPPGQEAAYDQVYLYRMRSVFPGGSTSPAWSNVVSGYRTLQAPLMGDVSYRQPVDGIFVDWVATGVDLFNLFRDDQLIVANLNATEYLDDSPVARDGEEHSYYVRGLTLDGQTEPAQPRTGRALLIDTSHVNDQPAPIPFGLTLDIVAGNLPFSAYINIDAEVGFCWADTPYPAGPADWHTGLISAAPEGEIDNHFSVSVCVSDGVPLVFFGRGSSDPALLCAVPSVIPPQGPQDWDIHEVVDAPAYVGMLDAAIVNGRPGVAVQASFTGADPNSSYFCTAATDSPGSSADWTSTPVTLSGDQLEAALAEFGGKPCMPSTSDNLRFNFGRISQPLLQDDFLSTYIGDQASVGSTTGTNFSMTLTGPGPGIAYRSNDMLVFAYSPQTLPADETDWRLRPIELGVSAGYETSLVDYAPQGEAFPSTALMTTYSPDSDSIWLVNANTGFPYDGVFSWYWIEPEPSGIKHGFSNAMTLQDGLPVIIYSVEESIDGELKYMRGY
ncbi:hypothetical protein KDL44_09965 [bacterium]|nr:hypothetical protein [bacterium]